MENNMNYEKIESVIEGILFASGEPVSINKIAQTLSLSCEQIETAAKSLADDYDYNRRGIKLVLIDNKLQMCSRPEFAEYIRTALEKRKKPTLSKAAFEVLAIIAYRQPTTRVYIEHVRGVDSSSIVAALEDKGLIEECGKLEVMGKPILYKTTDNFLRSFGISNLSQLPQIELNNIDTQN